MILGTFFKNKVNQDGQKAEGEQRLEPAVGQVVDAEGADFWKGVAGKPERHETEEQTEPFASRPRRVKQGEAGDKGAEKNIGTRFGAGIKKHEIIGAERAHRPRGFEAAQAAEGHCAKPEVDQGEEETRDGFQRIGRVVIGMGEECGKVAVFRFVAPGGPDERLEAADIFVGHEGWIPVEKGEGEDEEKSGGEARNELPIKRGEEKEGHHGERFERDGQANPRGGGGPARGGDFGGGEDNERGEGEIELSVS